MHYREWPSVKYFLAAGFRNCDIYFDESSRRDERRWGVLSCIFSFTIFGNAMMILAICRRNGLALAANMQLQRVRVRLSSRSVPNGTHSHVR